MMTAAFGATSLDAGVHGSTYSRDHRFAERADLVVAGCAILETIMDLWPAERIGIADRGIREGILRGMHRVREAEGARVRLLGAGTILGETGVVDPGVAAFLRRLSDDYRFDVVSDYGAFRDLQRHRMLTIEWQPLTPDHGYVLPELIDEAGEAAHIAEAIQYRPRRAEA